MTISGILNLKRIDKARLYAAKSGDWLQFTLIETPKGRNFKFLVVQSTTRDERADGVKGRILGKAGYAADARIAKGFRWLLATRQNDGGWAIPMRTLGIPFSEFVNARRHPRALGPDRSKPSSHLVTGMVLRAFAAHATRRTSAEALRAADFLASRLYQKDGYGDRGDVGYWERVSFPFWFTDVVSALDTLSLMQLPSEAPPIRAALERLRTIQRADGTFGLRIMKNKHEDLPWWICLAVCRILARWRYLGR